MRDSRLNRRQLLSSMTALGLAAPATLSYAAQPAKHTLRILQWNHFVPGYDEWFHKTWIREWGEKNDTQVIVDNVGMSSLRGRARAEVAAQSGHDLVMFLSPPPLFEDHVIDHREIYEECERRYGKPLDIAIRSTRNPRTGKFYGFSDSFVPDPVNYRTDLWAEVGIVPDTWDDIRTGARLIRERFGIPAGFGLAPELDTNMALRSFFAAFGASIQNADSQPVFASPQTVEAMKFMKAIYQESMTDEVFTWDPSSNNRMMLAGRGSVALNAISITRTGENQKIRLHENIGLAPPAAGPVQRIGLYHLLDVYSIWKFARNIEGAKRFLVDFVGQSRRVVEASEFYNLPCFPDTVPDLNAMLQKDPKGVPADKYGLFARATEWTTNVGYPGYANAATDEIFNSWILSDHAARAARGDVSPEEAVADADRAMRVIFDKWREAGKV